MTRNAARPHLSEHGSDTLKPEHCADDAEKTDTVEITQDTTVTSVDAPSSEVADHQNANATPATLGHSEENGGSDLGDTPGTLPIRVQPDLEDGMNGNACETEELRAALEVTPTATDPVAMLVEERLQEAEPVDPDGRPERPRKNSSALCALVGLAIAIAFISLVVVFAATNAGSTEVSNGSVPDATLDSSTANRSSDEIVLKLLPDFTIQKLRSPTSPQSQAMEWVLQDPNLFNYSDVRIRQRFALATLFHATNGHRWANSTNWMDYTSHECDWHSVTSTQSELRHWAVRQNNGTCHDADSAFPEGECRQLWLHANSLGGPIPPEVYLLTGLQSVDIALNKEIGGGTDTQIGRPKGPECLEMTGCSLTGTPPTDIGRLTNLSAALAVGSNSLGGTVPTEIGTLSLLKRLELHENQLTGPIPAQLWQLSGLERLMTHHNSLDLGALPTEMFHFPRLECLGLSELNISGSIPTEIGLLSSLEEAFIWDDALTGPIPTQMGLLSNLKMLLLMWNRLTRPLPTELLSSTSLEVVLVGTNHVTGSIPTEVGLLTNLRCLDTALNQISGTIPNELGLATSIGGFPFDWSMRGWMDLSSNVLSGGLPAELGSLVRLGFQEPSDLYFAPTMGALRDGSSYLWVHGNILSGAFSADLAKQLATLEDLDISGNHFTGSLPSELGLWINLVSLNLANNQFSGTLPVGLGKLMDQNGSLALLNVTGTSLTGVIPEGLCAVEGLGFDCSSQLCGCDCACLAGNVSTSLFP